MAKAALTRCDRLYLTSDNPRSEDPRQILSDALQGLSVEERRRVFEELDRREAIHKAWRALPSGGALLIAGKGHESYQEVTREGRTRRFALSDAESLRAAALAERAGLASPSDLPYAQSLVAEAPSAAEVIYEASLREGGLTLVMKLREGTGEMSAPEGREHLSISVEGLEDALQRVTEALKPRHRSLELLCADREVFDELYDHLNEGLSALICAHRGARALSADEAEGLTLRRGRPAPTEAGLARAGWTVGGASAAYIPSLARP